MKSASCLRNLHRTKRLFVIFTMLLSGSVFCTLYILTLSCCAGVLDPDDMSPSGRLAKVILIRDGDEDESKYQQVLEQTGADNNLGYLHFRRKPLLEDDTDTDPVVSHNSHRRQPTHGRRRHKSDPSDNSVHTDPVIRYDDDSPPYDNLDNHGLQEYDPASKSTSYQHHKKDRTHNNKVPNNSPKSTFEKSTRKLPQAIIIGVKKGGTRALLEFLRMHPDVRAPGPEPHFFDRNYEKGLDWYRRQMPPTLEDQVTMEKTPGYFVTKGVPGRIFNMSKNVKFIVVVRDPVTRAISDYTQALAKRDDISSFEAMAFEDNSTGLVDTSWGAIRIGVYAKHLERWLQYFPLSQMHFVSGERLISDPAGEIGKVQDFLGLERLITDKNFLFNTTKGFPCLVRPDRNRKKPHCLSKTKGREHPKIDPKVLQRLRDFFRPFNQKFYQMVGQDFGWS